jgi:hypothetical protein
MDSKSAAKQFRTLKLVAEFAGRKIEIHSDGKRTCPCFTVASLDDLVTATSELTAEAQTADVDPFEVMMMFRRVTVRAIPDGYVVVFHSIPWMD